MIDAQADWLKNISPLDGRYRVKVHELGEYFSEGALIKARVKVEIVYLIKLTEFLNIGSERKLLKVRNLIDWGEKLTDKDLLKVKEIEKEINHDVKAVEYFIRENLKKLKLEKLSVWIHWGLTSEDVNNLAYGLLLSRFNQEQLLVGEKQLLKKILLMAEKYQMVVMPGRTHGQLAVPTTMGKELAVFADRADFWLKKLQAVKFGGKLNGAVGNFNAQMAIYPEKDWQKFSQEVVESLGLEAVAVTTQIEPGDRLAYWLDLVKGLNNVWLNLSQDAWLYVALDYWQQKAVKKEVGSSTMPQKVNPIDFENAEGNLEIANALLGLMAEKLTISRLQRDLSDSTVKRNLGVALGHTVLAMKSLLKGLGKVAPNQEKLKQELAEHPEMLAEAEQLKLKTEGDAEAYEKIKKLTRGKKKGYWGEVEKYIGLAVNITKQTVRRLK
ncbi:MAG: adenylosuccinate lyase [Patescibacteria group bacterium]|nr:adenylosuccinate lyase [Patescibacteria group bacterium]